MNDLVTERLVLHPLSVAEARQLVADGPERPVHWGPEYPMDGDRRAMRHLLDRDEGDGPGHPGVFEIRRREDGQAIGGIGFHGPADEHGSVTIGYGLIPSARGRGYASEALRGLLEFARAQGFARVKGDADHDNTASQRVMRSAGMRQVGQDAQVVFFETAWDGAVPAPLG
ncbi:GNAT family N-acetyltransferase [Streptomyces palmae]|uniref:N-acetyltransferase n=1 Tax=Streptomyces palmae TaxID=1701085 RepID=A0A4Z0HFG2_9ACTN|nr:GNAT family N-acetyltransferase [Streptomyces palmae]TGB13665.1 N-acetyltransferase [Streptomyces palmae]